MRLSESLVLTYQIIHIQSVLIYIVNTPLNAIRRVYNTYHEFICLYKEYNTDLYFAHIIHNAELETTSEFVVPINNIDNSHLVDVCTYTEYSTLL